MSQNASAPLDGLIGPSSCPCANSNTTTGNSCRQNGSKACSGCFLVLYCSRECQESHWKEHKVDCKSKIMKSTWRPSWEDEQRMPSFMSSNVSWTTFGKIKFLWGNVPALDVINLQRNEGLAYSKDISLLFAASGDPRNVIKSIAGIPANFSQSITALVNDKDFDVVARNVILLLIALYVEPAPAAAAAMLHTWYSALIPSSVLRCLHDTVLPLIRDVCEKIKDKPADSLLSKTFKNGTCSMRVVLKKSSWDALPGYLEVPHGLTMEEARRVRRATTMAEERKDYLERALFTQPPGWRTATKQFRSEGILMPFGASLAAFDTPNPTFYQERDVWPMKDSANPLDGWSLDDIFQKTPLAKNDLYGGLFFHIRELLVDFCSKLKTLKMSFTLININVIDLPKALATDPTLARSFDRIEASNIIDLNYLGLQCLHLLVPFLRPVGENPHATLVTLFQNAIGQTITQADKMETMMREMPRVLALLTPTSQSPSFQADSATSADAVKRQMAYDLLQDFDGVFERYKEDCRFDLMAQAAGVKLKSEHTIVSPWPYRLSKNPTKAELEKLLGSGLTGDERYVEWQRAH
ncbi:uncharacterized protein IWZ02DRAFT_380899 [Phyllosticta citriasiana]|uniref:uncharacterized protein n=1 Tax=Phyllosticta citriasiana TaxID=595635 RepID=UPI0030FDABA8